jgi:hypothetical protein
MNGWIAGTWQPRDECDELEVDSDVLEDGMITERRICQVKMRLLKF